MKDIPLSAEIRDFGLVAACSAMMGVEVIGELLLYCTPSLLHYREGKACISYYVQGSRSSCCEGQRKTRSTTLLLWEHFYSRISLLRIFTWVLGRLSPEPALPCSFILLIWIKLQQQGASCPLTQGQGKRQSLPRGEHRGSFAHMDPRSILSTTYVPSSCWEYGGD